MVTFTEAAAGEMRGRLREELERWRDEAPGPHPRCSSAAIDEQLALLDAAHISTLHSFCLELIRDHFQELHLDPQVTVLDETQTVPLIHGTLDALLERCYSGKAGPAETVKQLLRQEGGAEEKIRALVLKLHRHTQSLPPSERWLERERARLDAAAPDHWRAWLVPGVIEWRDEWMPAATALAESPHVARCVDAIRRLTLKSSFDAIAAAMREMVAAEKEEWSSPWTKKDFRDPIRSFFDDAKFILSLTERRDGREPLLEDWQWMRAPAQALLWLAQEFTSEFTRAKRAQGGVDFADLEQLALELLVDERGAPTEIARLWQQRFQHVFVDECQDINGAQDAIIRAVSRDGNAERGARSAEPGPPPGNRFLVGDVKQSIYRFRLADPAIFRRYEEQWRSGGGGQRIPLADNFRSREAILHFINPLFAALMRPGIGGVGYEADAQLRFGSSAERAALSVATNPGACVELHVLHKTAEEEAAANGEENGAEAAAVAGEDGNGGASGEDVLDIEKEARLVARRLSELRRSRQQVWDEEREAMRDVDWRDMVVLLRSPAARVEAFAKEFSRAGVPLAAARAGFHSALEVQDLTNLLRLLDNPLQDIPLAAVLRSPLVALSPDELATVRALGANGDRHATFFSAVNHFYYKERHGDAAAAAAAHAKLKRYYESFARWRALVRQTSVSHCLEKVLAETHYEALLLAEPRGRERVANVRRLLELARQYDPFQRQGLYRFLRFIDEQQEAELDEAPAAVEVSNAVRLMSIHQSKGLEFPVVVVACLAGQFNTQDLREDILLSAEFGLCPKIVPPHVEQRYPSLPWWLARRRESRERSGEEMRLLYVAMTRARDRLILTAFDKSRHAGARWHLGPADLEDRSVLKAQSPFGWVRRWLGTTTTDANWSSEREGQTDWLRWELHPDKSSELLTTVKKACAPVASMGASGPLDIDALRLRLTWQYPFAAAAEEPAKTNVSVLRRRATEQDEEARQLWPPRRMHRDGTLTAAEAGSIHHLFMQHVRFERTGSVLELRNEAQRLVAEGFFTAPEAAALDYEALLAFWTSAAGRHVIAEQARAQRELPFTVRFSIDELRGLGVTGLDVGSDEFVVVQGIVDLALMGEDGIEIIDFKTDRVRGPEAQDKADTYAPQLRIYAAGLSAIYGRPVRCAAVHFFASGQTLPISVS
jgi:ATP-dependent helicase/nuclease subunit A